MNNRETGWFAIYATAGCIITDLENLNAKGGVQLAATIKRNFEELGV